MRRIIPVIAAFVLLLGRDSQARTPEIAFDSNNSVWIANGDQFIYQTLDRWSVFSAGGNVNRMVVDGLNLWIATDDGVIRMDTGSRKFQLIGMDDGLPSQRVSTVAKDEQFVWFGTNKGLVRYRKTDRSLRVYDEEDGLPSKAILSSVSIGRQVWFGTRSGIAYYSPDVDGLRSFGEADGLPEGEILELLQVGDDLWCRMEGALVRFRIQQRVFTVFPLASMNATQLNSVTSDGMDLWLGTDKGLFQFQSASDSIIPWQQQSALKSKNIKGVEVKGQEYVFIATDSEVVQYSKITKSIRRFALADGLTREVDSVGTIITAEAYTVVFPSGVELLNIKLDQWVQRGFDITENKASRTTARLFGKLDSSMPYDFNLTRPKGWRDGFTKDRYANLEGGLGLSHQFEKEQTLNASVKLDYGQLEASGIRDLQYKVEYLGNQTDYLREIRAEDKLQYRYTEEGLERPVLLQGATMRIATANEDPKLKVNIDTGFRRGQVFREFITGPRREVYPLKNSYIIPGTERVYLDGELLTNGIDYMLMNTAGQLLFLNLERFDDLSVITVEYEYDLVPKKELGALSLSSMLPYDNEIGAWIRAGDPQLISDSTALYNQIDGAAPKYIERFWMRSVYGSYRQGARSLQVALHDMGAEDNAASIYNFDLPISRVPIEGLNDETRQAVVDTGLPNAYAVKARFEQFYLEINVDDRSDASLVFVKAFAKAILDRKKQVTASKLNQFKEWLTAARVASSPQKGLEVGARISELKQLDDQTITRIDQDGVESIERVPSRSLLTGAVDSRYQRPFGTAGLLTAYGELAGSHEQTGGTSDGLAGMGFLRVSHPRFEGMFSGRSDSRDWASLTSTDARFGKFHDEFRANATGYPTTWLPTTVFFTRQRNYLADGSGGQGLIQHAVARTQLNLKGLPATTLQVGATELDNPNAYQTSRLQGSAQIDYDLAEPLAFTGIKRWNIRALYSVSQAETEQQENYLYGDRVRLMRLETKFSPTATESLWALYRSRDVGRQEERGGAFWRGAYRWELMSGAQSMIIPGLVPKLTYNVSFDDGRMPEPRAPNRNESPWIFSSDVSSRTALGPGTFSFTPITKSSKGTAGAGVGIYPGQWFPKLSAVAIEPSIALSSEEQAIEQVMQKSFKTWDLIGLEVYAGQSFELEFFQRYQIGQKGQNHDAWMRSFTSRNRALWRPRPTSPITWRYNYQRNSSEPIPMALSAGYSDWSLVTIHDVWLEWLNRWNKRITTRVRLNGNEQKKRNSTSVDESSKTLSIYNNTQLSIGGDVESRLYPMDDVSALYLYQRLAISRNVGWSYGARDSWVYSPVAGIICRIGDKMYLDSQFVFGFESCVSGTCTPVTKVEPRLYLTVNL